MSTARSTSSVWRSSDHFEPDENLDPQAQRRLRGHLEQIDYIAYAANREVVGAALQNTCAASFQRLAVAAAQARVRWVAASLAATESGQPLTREQIDKLADLKRSFHEISDAYEAMRRMVERGYVAYAAR
jgi:hypothetical protein